METQRSARRIPHLAHVRDGRTHFVERRSQRGIESLSRVRKVNAPRRTTHERDTEPLFESPHCLTDGGVGDAEPVAGRTESLRFRERNEGGHAIQFICHW